MVKVRHYLPGTDASVLDYAIAGVEKKYLESDMFRKVKDVTLKINLNYELLDDS